jgi:hypothetical protein
MYFYYEINYTCEIYMKLTFTYNINKTKALIQTNGTEHRFYVEIVTNITTRNEEHKDI